MTTLQNQTYTLHTLRGERQGTLAQAVSAASRPRPGIGEARHMIDAPRGCKGRVLELAKARERYVSGLRSNPERARRRWDPLTASTVAQRVKRRLLTIGLAEIERRGLDAPAGWDDFGHTVTRASRWDGDDARRCWLISGEGWYEYSKRFGSRYQAAAYLCGRDEGQLFAVRVPSTVSSVGEALEWLKPSMIRKAEEQGLPVRRQGDIFFRPVRNLADHELGDLAGTRHEARPRKDGGMTIVHPQHRALILSGKHRWRAYRSTQMASRGRRAAD